MSLVFEKLAQSLAAGQMWPVGIGGDFFRLDAADWPVTVALYRNDREIGRMANMRAGDYVRDVEFDKVLIINGATAQAVTLQIAGGGVGSDRVIGEVSIIDGGRARTKENGAFMGRADCGNLAGQYPHCQVWNPAGSGRRMIISKIWAGSDTAGYLQFGFMSAAMTTSSGQAKSKLSGGADSVAETRNQNSASALFTTLLWSVQNAALTVVNFDLDEPIVVLPGYGLSLKSSTISSAVTGVVEFCEEAV